MARLLSVHGTFASGPEEGEKWWQRGGELHRDMTAWIEADEGEFSFEPVIWDGANSEASRRKAGQALARRMAQLEAAKEPYALVGHSHGGSVIAASLMQSASKKRALERLRIWITVGTPFIATRKERMLFSRLGTIGKSIYVGLVTAFVMFVWGFLASEEEFYQRDHLVEAVTALLMVGAPFLLFNIGARLWERRRLYFHSRRAQEYARAHYRSRWLSLWHGADEAVQGLRSLKELKFEFFARDFAAPLFSLFSVFLPPILLVALATAPLTMRALVQGALDSGFYGSPEQFARIFDAIASIDVTQYLDPARPPVSDSSEHVKALTILAGASVAAPLGLIEAFIDQIEVAVPCVAAALLLIALTLNTLVSVVARGLSALLSRSLNPMTMGQIRATAFGSDTPEDNAVDASDWPAWLGKGYPPLPDGLGDGLQARSDAAIGKVIPKFRDAVRAFSATEDLERKSDMISEYLTWDELIHTSYFREPAFRKLIAYAICQTDGFRPSAAFKADPEFARIAAWSHSLSEHAQGVEDSAD